MVKKLALFISILFSTVTIVKTEEGMWLLPLLKELNIDSMQQLGCKLSAEDIYSLNNSSLKDAVVIFGGGCTAELISPEGLLITNHHCGYSQIQSHSSVENDYLEEGFWAMSKEEELPNPDLEVTFMISIKDVTDSILTKVPDSLSYRERLEKIGDISNKMESAITDTSHYEAVVESFFNDNVYYLVIYESYQDVRLVGSPPSSIGKFGFDTDNWMWPRHTGDFSLFRVYSGPDGKPATYAQENIPLQPKHYFPISIKGYKKGDITMVMGFPGSTDRYMTSYGVQELQDVIHPNRIKIRGLRQEILMKDMRADPAINIMYALKYSRSSNYWKYSIGQSKGISRLHVIEEKQALEEAFQQWAVEDSSREITYGKVLDHMQEAYQQKKPYTHAQQYLYECFIQGAEIYGLANKFGRLYNILSEDDVTDSKMDSTINEYKELVEEHFKDYNAPTDKKVTLAMIKLYQNNVPENQHPELYKVIKKSHRDEPERYVDALFRKSMFASGEQLLSFLDRPKAKKLQKDPAFEAARSVYMEFSENHGKATEPYFTIQENNNLFMQGLKAMQPNKVFYPDANFTMRLTYGTVEDYYPKDAVYYDYYTTLKGVKEKHDPDNYEFEAPEKLLQLYSSKDYGMYAQNDTMQVCFITTNDITGGNSGSPVLDANGNLLGLAFDGNWEAMSGDIIYEPELQRCINVDIRYVLFVIDKYANAGYLLDEMNIVK